MPCLEYSKYSEYLQKTNCLKSCLGDTFVMMMMMMRPRSAFRQQVCCGNGCHASPAFTANDCDCPVLFQISALAATNWLSSVFHCISTNNLKIRYFFPVASQFRALDRIRNFSLKLYVFRIGQRNSFGLINLNWGSTCSLYYFIINKVTTRWEGPQSLSYYQCSMSKVGTAKSYIRSRVQHEVILEVGCSTRLY